MNVLSLLSYPSEEALHQLDPTQLLGGSLNMSDHLMLTSVIGAVGYRYRLWYCSA